MADPNPASTALQELRTPRPIVRDQQRAIEVKVERAVDGLDRPVTGPGYEGHDQQQGDRRSRCDPAHQRQRGDGRDPVGVSSKTKPSQAMAMTMVAGRHRVRPLPHTKRLSGSVVLTVAPGLGVSSRRRGR
jgi:hypothetical protein